MYNQPPRVSICIPTYNAAKTIHETLVSLLNQTYSDFKIYIVDNASMDDTLAVAESMADPRIQIHRHDVNVGGEGNFNRCIQLAQGEYTAIFHADDIYEPEMVGRQLAFFDHYPEIGAVFTEALLIDESGKVFGSIGFPSEVRYFDGLCDFSMLFKTLLRHSNFLICPSVMARTDVYREGIKAWRGDLFKSSADLDVWLRIAQKHRVGLIAKPLMRYRVSSAQYSARVRLQTERADFFRVTDYYLAQASVRDLLDAKDIENLKRLDRRDKMMRAINCVLVGQMDKARMLLEDSVSWGGFKAGLQTKRGLGVFLTSIYLKTMLFFNLYGLARLTMTQLKCIARK